MKAFSKSIILSIMISTSANISAIAAESEKNHEEQHQKMDNKATGDMKASMVVYTARTDDFLDMGDKMIQKGKAGKDANMMLKGAETLNMGIQMSMKVIDFDHAYLSAEVPHEVMHKNHMASKNKLSRLISERAKDLVSMGDQMVKTARTTNNNEMLLTGGKLLNTGLEMQMLMAPKPKSDH